MKKTKTELKKDSVNSNTIHVGIELELFNNSSDLGSEHDDDACYDYRIENHQDYLNDLSFKELLDYIGVSVSRSEADILERYVSTTSMIDDIMQDYQPDSCDDDDCPFSRDVDNKRDELKDELKSLTTNSSFKVVEDGSIDTEGGFDAEVCWNYFISKDTLKDNALILKHLDDQGYNFNKTCGLHINLNDYNKLYSKLFNKNLSGDFKIPTDSLSFLFNLVGKSRESNTYCNRFSLASSTKYSMIYIQNDRLEFRFFSPTLNAEKLNNYVSLAHHVYKRLSGINCKLSKKLETYFIAKMKDIRSMADSDITYTIDRINNIMSLDQYISRYFHHDEDNHTHSTESSVA